MRKFVISWRKGRAYNQKFKTCTQWFVHILQLKYIFAIKIYSIIIANFILVLANIILETVKEKLE